MAVESEGSDSSTEDRSISLARANVLTLVFSLPLAAVLWIAYSRLHPDVPVAAQLGNLPALVSLLLAVAVAVPLHEAIHALGWSLFGRVPLRRVRFGIAARTLNPYAHLPDAIPARAYRWGTALPGLTLGLLPYLAAMAAGSAWWMLFGLTLTLAAGGDALVLWLLRGVPPQALVLDHPSRAGCLVISHQTPPLIPASNL